MPVPVWSSSSSLPMLRHQWVSSSPSPEMRHRNNDESSGLLISPNCYYIVWPQGPGFLKYSVFVCFGHMHLEGTGCHPGL